jgi:hypothetical protein
MTADRPATHDRKSKEEETAVSTTTPPVAERRPALRAASPLLFDVAVPVGLYYLLSAAGVADTPALIVSGLVPFTVRCTACSGPGRPTTWR